MADQTLTAQDEVRSEALLIGRRDRRATIDLPKPIHPCADVLPLLIVHGGCCNDTESGNCFHVDCSASGKKGQLVFLTAGHNLFCTRTKSHISQLLVKTPDGKSTIVTLVKDGTRQEGWYRPNEEYVDLVQRGSGHATSVDYGVIVIDEAVFNRLPEDNRPKGGFSMMKPENFSAIQNLPPGGASLEYTVLGHEGGQLRYHTNTAEPKMNAETPRYSVWHYDIDTEEGQSGSPLFWGRIDEFGYQRMVVGIHACWMGASVNLNAGVILDECLFKSILNWKAPDNYEPSTPIQGKKKKLHCNFVSWYCDSYSGL